MAGEGPDEGPLDEPVDRPFPVGDPWNPDAASENYRQERLNQNLRRGGRGCLLPWTLVGLIVLVAGLALAGR